jgi:hypothetical protein
MVFYACHWQGHIQRIRENYTKDFKNKDVTRRQIVVATYLIDKLALRAGNEKVHPTGICLMAMSDAPIYYTVFEYISDVSVGNLVSYLWKLLSCKTELVCLLLYDLFCIGTSNTRIIKNIVAPRPL